MKSNENIREDADQLVERFSDYSNYYKRGEAGLLEWSTNEGRTNATQCAIVCIERELELLRQLRKPEYSTFITDHEKGTELYWYEYIEEKELILNELKNRLK